MKNERDCIIIGSGPSGLSLAAALQKNGVSALVIEKGSAAETWRIIPKHTRLISPWWTNIIGLNGIIKEWPWKEVYAKEYYQHLIDFIKQHEINILTDCKVEKITKHTHQTYKITTSKGVFYTSQLVCASGYYSNPANPRPKFKSDDSIKIIHTSNIKDFAKIPKKSNSNKILIVGKRTSAGQTLLAYHEKGYSASISSRSKINFRRDGFYGKLRETIYFIYEPVWVRIKKNIRSNSYPTIDGGTIRKLIQNNIVPTKPIIKEVKNNMVYFENGDIELYDMIILATGYRPALSYINGLVNISEKNGLPAINNFQSTDSRGIYFLGFDNIYDFRSRYLRGIRHDAKILSKIIYAQIKKTSPSPTLNRY